MATIFNSVSRLPWLRMADITADRFRFVKTSGIRCTSKFHTLNSQGELSKCGTTSRRLFAQRKSGFMLGRDYSLWQFDVSMSSEQQPMSASLLSKRFGAVVRKRRINAGMSQEAFSEIAQVHPTYVSMVERGIRNPTLDVADRIARALKTTLPKLIEEAQKNAAAV